MRALCIFFILLSAGLISGQTNPAMMSGEITYSTSQHIYLRFASTKGLMEGDTLFLQTNTTKRPAAIIKSMSSTSVVCTPLDNFIPEKGMLLEWTVRINNDLQNNSTAPAQEEPPGVVVTPEDPEPPDTEKEEGQKKEPTELTPSLKGRISVASYNQVADHTDLEQQRMRYSLTLQAKRIAGSRISFDSYLSFRHTLGEWHEVQQNFKRAFKMYQFALRYDFNTSWSVTAGRKINHLISNIGAIDGLQIENTKGRFTTGLIAGSRPDHQDYGLNPALLQLGGYMSYQLQNPNGIAQSTLAFAEQRNSGQTDRRFIYLQHQNGLIKRVYLFGSVEYDLYSIQDSLPSNAMNLTSVYISLRWRLSAKVTLFGSYDARRNVIYYETYKSFLDQLLEDETRQGLRLNVQWRPVKRMTVGVSGGYRFQKESSQHNANVNSYIMYNRVPGLNGSATATWTWMESPYLTGNIIGLRLSRDFGKGKFFGEMSYRIVSYQYRNIEFPIGQSILGAQVSWRITRKESVSCQYELEHQTAQPYHRIYTHITHRF